MTLRYRVEYEPSALEALREIVQYVKKDSGAPRARKWLQSLLKSVDKLETLPKAFTPEPDLGGFPFFSKLVPPYRVFYIIDDTTTTVHVIDIVHTARETKLSEYRGED